ncbi:MAG: isopenicillin N synthase family oxygenase [Alphaproteobacteria bacterium]|jgi:isopenicillin N synthase-like dioxygenase|nr:isopenicillin N synthase family oxygenase [Alphaproteobacteria bacterium]
MTLDRLPRAYDKAMEIAPDAIPVIDLGPFRLGDAEDKARIAAEIGTACETVGFFYVVDHGIPQSLIDAAFEQNRRFFAQPMAERMKTAATLEHWRGYVPSKPEGEGGAVGGAIETFRLMLDLPWDDPDVAVGKPLHLPNRWPEHLPGFRADVQAYFDAQMALSAILREAFARALGLDPDFFEPWYEKPLVQLSLLHYRPPRSGDPADLEIGAGEHRDTGAFTILMQDQVGGLEVGHRDHGWVAAPPIPGAYVINIGDMMMHWTNGRFVSTPHRVVNRAAQPRYSMPFFVNPDFDVTVEPLPGLMQPGESPRFEPLHNGRFMVDFYDAGMAYLRRDA